MATELGSYVQAHTSLSPLTAGNTRAEESLASLKELGSNSSVTLNLPNEVTFHVPLARVCPGAGPSGPLPTTAIQIITHQPLHDPSAGGGPMGRRTHVTSSAVPNRPMGRDPVTWYSPMPPSLSWLQGGALVTLTWAT